MPGVQHAVEVDLDDAVPIGRIRVDERADLVPTGFVDQYVDPAVVASGEFTDLTETR